jgi:hypothetical protein
VVASCTAGKFEEDLKVEACEANNLDYANDEEGALNQ